VPRAADTRVEILLGRTEEVANPYTRAPMLRRIDAVEPTMMDAYIAFAAAEEEVVPRAYYVPPELTAVVDLLAAHGVDGTPLETDRAIPGQRFEITASTVAARPVEGHRLREVEGTWADTELSLPAGTLEVQTAQPLGRLLFTLLEPRSDDGLVAWNVLDDNVAVGAVYPIARAPVESAEPLPSR